VTDDIRPATGSPVDLLVIGGLTVDVLDGREAAGGAARYAVEGGLAAGLSVGLWTVAGDERPVQAWLGTLPGEVHVTRQVAARSIRFEHHGAHDRRRLRLAAHTEPIEPGQAPTIPQATAVLFAPVAGEIAPAALTDVAGPFRAAGLQGWLRIADADGWVQPRALSDLDPTLAAALRDLDLLVASEQDIDKGDGSAALAALRAWAGPGPELVVTAGADGAWLNAGDARPVLIPAQVVEGRNTIGAGDAFTAVLATRRAAGDSLVEAAVTASTATGAYLATRPGPASNGPGVA
jgi:sugar/nucleoside kinase (ribokinase family)